MKNSRSQARRDAQPVPVKPTVGWNEWALSHIRITTDQQLQYPSLSGVCPHHVVGHSALPVGDRQLTGHPVLPLERGVVVVGPVVEGAGPPGGLAGVGLSGHLQGGRPDFRSVTSPCNQK